MSESKLWSLLLGCADFSDLIDQLSIAGGVTREPDFVFKAPSRGIQCAGTRAFSYRGMVYKTRRELIKNHAQHGLTCDQVERRITSKGWNLEKALTTPLGG